MSNTDRATHSQSMRLRKILAMLRENKRVTQAELAEASQCSKKSIQRAVSVLQADAWPIEHDGVGYFLNSSYRDGLKVTSNSQIAALVLTGCVIDKHLADYFPDLVMAIRGNILNQPDIHSFKYHMDNTSVAVDRCSFSEEELETFGALARSVIDGIAIHFSYRAVSKKHDLERAVYPISLKQRDGVWYLIGYDFDRSGLRVFIIKKVKNVKVCPVAYERPDERYITEALEAGEFSIWDMGNQSECYDIKVKLHGHAADFVRSNKIHSSQRFKILDDDTVMLYLKTPDLLGVNLWLRKYLHLVEIVEPQVLRDSFKRDLVEALSKYQ